MARVVSANPDQHGFPLRPLERVGGEKKLSQGPLAGIEGHIPYFERQIRQRGVPDGLSQMPLGRGIISESHSGTRIAESSGDKRCCLLPGKLSRHIDEDVRFESLLFRDDLDRRRSAASGSRP